MSETPAEPRRFAYGDDPSQFGELHLPEGTPRGVVVVIHGGFWRAAYDLTLGTPLAASLAARGLGGVEPGVPAGRHRAGRRRRSAADARRRRGGPRPAARPRPGPRHGAHPRALRGRPPRRVGRLARPLRAVARRRRTSPVWSRRPACSTCARPTTPGWAAAPPRRSSATRPTAADAAGRPRAAGAPRRAAGLRARPRRHDRADRASPRGTSRGRPRPARARGSRPSTATTSRWSTPAPPPGHDAGRPGRPGLTGSAARARADGGARSGQAALAEVLGDREGGRGGR